MAGYKKWVVNEALTSADVNDYLNHQSVMVFASISARDAAIVGADKIEGMICYINSGNSSEGLYAYNGANWVKGPGWNAPAGLISSKTDATNRVRTTTNAELTTTLRTTATFTNNRWLRFTLMANFSDTATGGGVVAEIYNVTSGVVVGRIAQLFATVGTGYHVANSIVATSAASAVYTVRIAGIANSVNVNGLAVSATQFIVEDIGASGNPV